MLRILFHGLMLLVASGAAAVLAAEAHSTNSTPEADMRKFQVAPGLKVELVAAEPLLQNPVCFSIDERGRFYVVETHRYRNAIFDITANTPWLLDDLSFRTVNDRAAFLARTFATNFAVLTNDSELIRLVEDRDGDGHAETSSLFADGFNKSVAGTAAGVLAQGTNVWFTCIPDLWRLGSGVISRSVISNQSAAGMSSTGAPAGVAAKTDLLITGLGVHISVSGHDVHGLIRGHDGRIYFSFGDRGVCATNREGAVLDVPDTGGVLRCEPDGRNLEIFCTGLRNPQELAFDDYGNLWTVDNDTAGADPCRVLHLIEGGDYGWRASYQHMKGFGPWVQEELWRGGLDGVLPPVGTVSQGPAGLAFHPGTSATPQLAGKFVHADFPGGVWAYSVKPRGASYELGAKEKILWNCWPTDVDFGPDGALYVLDWVQGWTPPGKGRIYRLSASAEREARNAELTAEVKRLLADGTTRRINKELLELLGHGDRRVRLEAQWELAERGQGVVSELLKVAIENRNEFARLHALWGLDMHWRRNLPPRGRRSKDTAYDQLLQVVPLLKDEDVFVRVRAADLLSGLQFLNADRPTKEMFKNSSVMAQCAAIRAQGRILSGFDGSRSPREKISRFEEWRTAFEQMRKKQNGGSRMAHPTGEILELSANPASNDAFLIHELTGFYEIDVGRYLNWNVPNGVIYTNHFLNLGTNSSARLAGLLAYRHLAYDGITNFVGDANPRLVLEMARAINDAPIPAADVVLAALLDDPRFGNPNWGWSALSNITPAGPFSAKVRPPRDQVLLRALNAHFRLGHATNAEALVRFALGASNSNSAGAGSETGAPMLASPRAEALFLLGAWEVLPAKVGDLPIKPTKDPNHGSVPTVNPENWPGWFDRVVGLYRPLPPRPSDDARRALAPHIVALLSDSATEVAQAGLDAAVKLRLTNAAPALVARLGDARTPTSVRRRIPAALATMDVNELGDGVKLALADADADIRAAALPYLGRLQGDDAVRILSDIVRAEMVTGSNSASSGARLAQAAFRALGDSKSTAANFSLRMALTNLLAGNLPLALELDLLDAATRRTDAEIKSLLAQRQVMYPKEDHLATWRPVLQGGDAERGREIFFEKVEVQCSRCHVVKGQGGTVGPALDGIGKRHAREYLLESMLFPSRAIAAGFENVTVTMRDGSMHAGLVKGEDERELRLESPEDGPQRLAKSGIVTRQRGLSAMPEGTTELLSRRELRDLVEFLAQLK